MLRLRHLIQTRVKKESILWKTLALGNKAVHLLFKNIIIQSKINTFVRNSKPDNQLRVIFGGHWCDTEGWFVLNEDDQDIRKPLRFPDECVDVIFTEHVIEHVDFLDAVMFMQESKRILKKGGAFRVVCPMIERIFGASLEGKNGKIYIQNCLINVWSEENKLLDQININGIFESPKTFLLNSIFTKHGHKFVWSTELMIKVLKAIGFRKVSSEKIGEGVNKEYCIERRRRGLYLGNDCEVDRSTNVVYDPESQVVEAIK